MGSPPNLPSTNSVFGKVIHATALIPLVYSQSSSVQKVVKYTAVAARFPACTAGELT